MFGIFENKTIFKGRLFFKFEKTPYYVKGGKKGNVFNKIILDFGFTKLVSRINNNVIDKSKIDLINKYTGGIIKTYTIPKERSFDEKNDYTLKHSFLSLDGKYIGNAQKGWWYFKNNLLVYPDKPNQVAIRVKDIKKSLQVFNNSIKNKSESIVVEQLEADNFIGFYGYSHRGGQTFEIGDRIFEERYEPVKEDYPEWQWEGWEEKFKKQYSNGDKFDKEMIYNDGIKSIIPFKFRGKKVIENWSDALQSAINIANYLS